MDTNYYSIIDEFWSSSIAKGLDNRSIVLYFYLIQRCYSEKTNTLTMSNKEITSTLSSCNRVLIKSKQELQKNKLVDIKIQNGNKTTYILNSPLFISLLNNIPVLPSPEITGRSVESKFDLTSEIIHNKKSFKTLDVSTNIPKRKIDIPSFADFFEYAKTCEGYNPKANKLIEAKYETWKADGWRNGLGKPIRNWKSAFDASWFHIEKQISIQNTLSKNNIPNRQYPENTYNE